MGHLRRGRGAKEGFDVAIGRHLKRAAAATAAAALIVSSAACSAHPGLAIQVGDVQATEQQVADVTREINAYLVATGRNTVTQRDIVFQLAINMWGQQLLADTGDAELVAAAQPPGFEEFVQEDIANIKEQLEAAGWPEDQVTQYVDQATTAIGPLKLSSQSISVISSQGLGQALNDAAGQGLIDAGSMDQIVTEAIINPRYGRIDPQVYPPVGPSYPWRFELPAQDQGAFPEVIP
jgi:hypothetical protein